MPRVQLAADELDPHSRRLRHVCGLDSQPVTHAQVRAARRAYYGAVSYVDDQIGVLLGALADAALRRRHHRAAARRSRRHAGRARTLVQDELLRAGLPRSADRACAAALRRRGVWRSPPRSSTSCRPCASSPAASSPTPRRRSTARACCRNSTAHAGAMRSIGEYLAEGAIAPLVMIKRGRYKFIHSPGRSRSALRSRRRTRTSCEISPRRWRMRRGCGSFAPKSARRWDLPALHAAVIASQQRRHLVYAALRTGRYTPWDFQPVRDASRLVRPQRSGSRRSRGHGAIPALARLTERLPGRQAPSFPRRK